MFVCDYAYVSFHPVKDVPTCGQIWEG